MAGVMFYVRAQLLPECQRPCHIQLGLFLINCHCLAGYLYQYGFNILFYPNRNLSRCHFDLELWTKSQPGGMPLLISPCFILLYFIKLKSSCRGLYAYQYQDSSEANVALELYHYSLDSEIKTEILLITQFRNFKSLNTGTLMQSMQ